MNYIPQLASLLLEISNNSKLNNKILEKFIKPAKQGIDADFSINCFTLNKILNLDGVEIAQNFAEKFNEDVLKHYPIVNFIKNDGPYLNISLNKCLISKDIFSQIYSNIDKYIASYFQENEKNQTLVVEFPSPNTNKPLHLGHVRNILLGQAISTLNEKVQNKVFKANLINDRGIHICKSMWAYEKFGFNTTPEKENRKSDHFIGDYYVKFAQEEKKLKNGLEESISLLNNQMKLPPIDRNNKLISKLEKKISQTEYGKMQSEVKQMLVDWENGVPKIRALWRKMNDWAEQGFIDTYNKFEIIHDKTYYESEIYNKGKDIVIEGLKKGIFEQLDDGAVVANFKKKGLPKQKVLIRRDGTTLYSTQDIYLAFQKMNDFHYDKSIYVIGNEQNMQLRTIFEILKKLGMKADNFHYSYGMINLTTGKMKSREGNVVDADNIVEELNEIALKEVKKRYDTLSEKDMKNRASIIAMAALRFFIIKYDYSRDFLFDMEKSISFEGETGPYILYSYARICSINRKAIELGISVPFNPVTNKISKIPIFKLDILSLLKDKHEEELISMLRNFPKVVSDSAKGLKPHILARFLYELAQEFTGFYHSCKIIGEGDNLQLARLWLIEAIRIVLKNGLAMLNIRVLNEM